MLHLSGKQINLNRVLIDMIVLGNTRKALKVKKRKCLENISANTQYIM